jgi:small-conductance mechanosensitive channel
VELIDQIPAPVRELITGTIVPILLIVVIGLIVIALTGHVVHGAIVRLLDREAHEGTAQELSAVEIQKRMKTIEGLATNVIRGFVILVATLMILGELNLDIGPAVAGLGVVGIAVGFGTQSIVRDYFTGALILIENQYSQGDVVSIAGVSGSVEDFSLRRTTLRDLSGVVHTVPNGEIHVASNMTRVWARINEDVSVAYDTDIAQATQVVNEVGESMAADPDWRRRIMEPPHVERVQALGDSGITLKVLGMVRGGEQWAAAGELRMRLLAAFAEHGIEIPYPHRVVISREVPPDPAAAAADDGAVAVDDDPGG